MDRGRKTPGRGAWREGMSREQQAAFDTTVMAVIQINDQFRPPLERLDRSIYEGELLPRGRVIEGIYPMGPGEIVGRPGWALLLQLFLAKDPDDERTTGEVLWNWIRAMWSAEPSVHIHGACSPDELDHFNEFWADRETGSVIRACGDTDDPDGVAAAEKLASLSRSAGGSSE